MPLQQINNNESGSTIRAKLNAWVAQIVTNVTNIATNTSTISTNTSNIATNTSNIATNTSNIATNTTDISTNTSNINLKQNRDAVSTVYDNLVPKTGSFTIGSKNDFYVAINVSGSLLTIPLNTASAFPLGSCIHISNLGTNDYTVTPISGVTMVYHNGTTSAILANTTAILIKIGTDTWLRYL